MEVLFDVAHISRQAFHRWRRPTQRQSTRTPQHCVLDMAHTIRKRYLPGSSAREVYFYIRNKHQEFNSKLKGWGKHSFEAFCLKNGLRVEHRRFVPKTTVKGDFVYPNIIQGIKISNINQVWVSDICYLYGTNGALLGYATSLIDLYSRRLLGLGFSQTMHAAVTSNVVIQQAFQELKADRFPGLIFHSDGGKQYIERKFTKALSDKEIKSSMAESCYENAFAEAFNDILKNHILYDLNINSFSQLKKQEHFIKYCYNHNRPHNSINRLTPLEFEQHILTLQDCQRTTLEIKVLDHSIIKYTKMPINNILTRVEV